MNHETMLAYLLGQRRGGGSSGGGVSLPTLTNPAGADQILEGYEAVDGSGNKVTGTHVCESGDGSDYWVPTDKNGEIWIGEEVASEGKGFAIDVEPTKLIASISASRVYRVTIDGTAYVCLKSELEDVTAGGVISFKYMAKGYWIVTFTDGMSHTLSVESWVPQVTEYG